jgi:hypothetical protein
MNKRILSAGALALLLTAGAYAQAFNPGIIGYVPSYFLTGSNLFNNSLQGLSNNLSYLFQPIITTSGVSPSPQEGTTVSLWNPVTSSFDISSTYTNGAWSVDLQLPPGTGALVITPKPFTNVIIGVTLNHDGSLFLGDDLTPPPAFSGPNGIYLLGDKSPLIDVGTNIFINIIGRMPFVGEQVTQLSGTSTYLGNGIWDSVPTLGLGDAAFLNIMTEPPPLLTILCTNNQAIISWPSTTSVWTLQTNSDLITGAWGEYIGPIVNNTVTNSTSAGNLFFRLSYP